jgi:hypothetical protein
MKERGLSEIEAPFLWTNMEFDSIKGQFLCYLDFLYQMGSPVFDHNPITACLTLIA